MELGVAIRYSLPARLPVASHSLCLPAGEVLLLKSDLSSARSKNCTHHCPFNPKPTLGGHQVCERRLKFTPDR